MAAATLTDLRDLVKVSLGTPETVNFKALHRLLTGILGHLNSLYARVAERDKSPKARTPTTPVDVSSRRDTEPQPGFALVSPEEERDSVTEDVSERKPKKTPTKPTLDKKRKVSPSAEPQPSFALVSPKEERDSVKEDVSERKPKKMPTKPTLDKKRKVSPPMKKPDMVDEASAAPSREDSGDEKDDLPPKRVKEPRKKSRGHVVVKSAKDKKGAKKTPTFDAESSSTSSSTGTLDAKKDKPPKTPKADKKTEGKGRGTKRESSKKAQEKEEEAPGKADDEAAAPDEELKEQETKGEEEGAQDGNQSSLEQDPDTSSDTEPKEEPEKPKEETPPAASEKSGAEEATVEPVIVASEEDFRQPITPPPPPEEQVTRQDLEDIVKRVVHLEQDMSRMKLTKKIDGYTKAGPSSTSTLDKEIENRNKRERVLQKHIERVEKDAGNRIDHIFKELNDMRAQLQYLPNAKELYKSYFPSWQMLEDAICAHTCLKEYIEEAKEAVGKDQGTVANKQLSRFLGTSGPSERLLEALNILSRVVEQGRLETFDLYNEVAEAKATTSSRRATGLFGMKIPMEGKAFKKTVLNPDDHDSSPVSVEPSDSSHTEPPPEDKSSVTKMESALAGMAGTDASYMNFKMAKLVEEILGIRKELDDMQLWKDKLIAVQGDIGDLTDFLCEVRREMDLKEEKDHEIVANLQMDLKELHTEICGLETRKDMQARKAEMDTVRQNVQETRFTTLRDIVIDREARIRTQQLQLQLNSVHQMVAEMERRLPDQVYSPAPTGMPEAMQHPWGTGRAGVGTNMRAGVGTTAATVASPTTTVKPGPAPSPSPPLKPTSDARPPPLGGGGSEDVGKGVTDIVAKISPHPSMQETEEKVRTQFAITRLNQGQSSLSARLEACLNQQSTENRRLQDLMTRMHKEYMVRCRDLQEQLSSVLGDKMEESEGSEHSSARNPPMHLIEVGEAADTQAETALQQLTTEQGRELTAAGTGQIVPVLSTHCRSAGQRGVSGAQSGMLTTDMLIGLRKELMGYIKALRRRLDHLETSMMSAGPEVDAALLKKRILHRFQCLSCDKRVDITQARADEGHAPASVVPELPRLPALTSPPRIRNATKSQTFPSKPLDAYEIPRHCGGSYTASNKPRRLHYYSSLGDVIDMPTEPVAVEKVDVKGTDGHIYKGQVRRVSCNSPSVPLPNQSKETAPPVD